MQLLESSTKMISHFQKEYGGVGGHMDVDQDDERPPMHLINDQQVSPACNRKQAHA
jgi:hypothetical protein